jgi:hypothetical protein
MQKSTTSCTETSPAKRPSKLFRVLVVGGAMVAAAGANAASHAKASHHIMTDDGPTDGGGTQGW